MPAQQCLEADDLIRDQTDLWLVVEFKFAACDGTLEIHLENSAQMDARVHLGLKEPGGAAALRLCQIKRDVSVPHQRLIRKAIAGRHAHPNARSGHDLTPIDIERL